MRERDREETGEGNGGNKGVPHVQIGTQYPPY